MESTIKVNHLLCLLVKIGWSHLYCEFFSGEKTTDPDMALMDWMFNGRIDDNGNTIMLGAWLAVEYEYNLNKLLHFLLKSNGDINFTDETGQTILHVFLRCCIEFLPRKAMLKVVKKLIEMGASVNAVDDEHCTPLHIAAGDRGKALMKLILSRFTNVTAASDPNGNTVLHDIIYACHEDKSTREHQYTNIVRTLLAKGANPNKLNNFGITPLQCAVQYNFFEILLIFQTYGADFHEVTTDGETLLHLACSKDKNPLIQLKIIDLLENQGCNVNAKDKKGQTPIYLAAKLRNEKIIARLIQLGGDVNLKSTNLHVTPLHFAALHNQPNNVKILLQAGANFDAEAKNGVTPLHIAASRDSIKSVKYLIKFGADLHRSEKNFNFTPLHIAMWGCKKKVKLLLKKGVDVNVSNEDGITPLHLASSAGNVKVVEILVKHDADVNCRGSKLKLTPLHLSMMVNNVVNLRNLIFNNKDLRNKDFFDMFKWISPPMMVGANVTIADLLIKNGTDVNVKDAIGRTPLHLATLQRTSTMIEALLKLGAYVDEYDDEGRTPLRNVLEYNKTTSGLACLLKFGLDVNDNDVIKVNHVIQQTNTISVGLLNHVIDLKMLGLPVHDSYNCIEELHVEAKRLKNCKIHGSNISVYDFLHMKPRGQVNLVKNVLNMNLDFEFPQYFNVIHASCYQAVNRVSLMELAIVALKRVTGVWWPELCAENILSCLNNRNLRILIDSANIDVV